ncbi:MAG TPA: hypothetical protein VFZ65_11705 [Planctomycetota bacterium]|nr:hypothetical protein [Planctomycetota bacterium]
MLRHLVLTVLPLSALTAQVLPGDIAITGFSTSQFGIATPPSVTGYTTSGFGSGTSQAILHDPATFVDFLVGGFGFVGRATITGPGTVSYTPLTLAVGEVSQMSWDGAGNIIVTDNGNDQVRMVTPAGVVIDLSLGTQPWGTTVNAGAYDPATGDIIVGNQGGLFRLPNGSSTGVPIVGGLGGYVSNVQFDPYTGDILATVLTASRLVRVDASGTVTDLVTPGTVPTPNALQVDDLGRFLVGSTGGNVYRIDLAGNATLIATNTSPTGTVSGLAYVHGGCHVSLFGSGCAAPNGPAVLIAAGDCAIGATLTTISIHHAPNAVGLAVLGLVGLTPPIDLGPLLGATGCSLYTSPDLLLGGLANPVGAFASMITSNATFAGQTLFVQHAVLEGLTLSSFTTSNAARIDY